MAQTGYFRLIKEGSISKKNKGVWLKAEVLFNTDMSLIEKVIVSVVNGYQAGNKDCFVSDTYLATLCSCNRSTINRNINSLVSRKILHKRYKKVMGDMKRVLWI